MIYITSDRNGCLMKIPEPFDPKCLTLNELVRSSEKFAIA